MKKEYCKICKRYYAGWEYSEHCKEDTKTHRKHKALQKMSSMEMLKAINRGEL